MSRLNSNRKTRHTHGLRNAFMFLVVLLIANVGIATVWATQPVRAAKAGAHPRQSKKIKPQIPKANRYQKNKVFLENADLLTADEDISTEYQRLKGNVRFRRGNMFMYCKSADFYDKTSSLDAFGHVKMTQGDTLFVYADILHYYGEDQVAELRHNVRLENRSTTLITDSLDYDMTSTVGYYFNRGVIVDNKNNTELSSVYGRYELSTKQAEFSTDVHLINDQYEMFTNLLQYNLNSHIAQIVDETVIVSDSNTIVTTNGWYNTNADDATLYNRSKVMVMFSSAILAILMLTERVTQAKLRDLKKIITTPLT